jgi:uncharacterized protein (DUF2461 family)
MAGESLTRPPRGFDADHPCIEDIKRKDFAIMTSIEDDRVVGPAFRRDVLDAFRAATPFLAFLSKAVGIAF